MLWAFFITNEVGKSLISYKCFMGWIIPKTLMYQRVNMDFEER